MEQASTQGSIHRRMPGQTASPNKVTDTNGQSAIATVNLNVQAAAVIATSDAYAANENQALTLSTASGILANDILPSGETGTVTVNTSPTHGTLALNSDGSFTYTPATGYAGADSFTYKVTDTNGQSAIATVNLNVQAAAVTATSDAYAANENQALTISTASGILANDILPNGETGTVTVNTGPTHGTLSLNTDGSFTYIPATGYAGADSFTYKVTDINGQSAIATVNLNVQVAAVTATSDAYAVNENQALTISTASGILANDILPNGETGTVSVNSGPAHGTLTLNTDGSFTYIPATGYAGTDSFTYKVTDTNGQSAIATVNLNVQAAAVTAASDAYSANENQALTISTASGVLANDILPNGEIGTIIVNTGPTHGALSLNTDGSFTYTPSTGYAGADSFTYKVTDTNGQSAIATINLNVQAAAVTATSDAYSANENQALTISTASGVLANDILPNGETGTITVNTGPAHGALSLNTDGSFTYTPATGYAGADSFTYKVTDTNGQSAIATVNLNVQAAAVTATSDAYTANENQALTISTASGVLANDILPNGETGTITINTGPAHGALSLNTDGSFSYTPATGYAGADNFTYKVTDTNGQSAIATVNLSVQAAAVTATSDAYTANENQALTISTASGVLANDILPNGETGTVTLNTGPAHGTLSLNSDGSFNYTPATGYAGTDSFTYKVTDTNGQSAIATINLNVQAAAVTATSDAYAANENQALTISTASGILANDILPNGETGTVSVNTGPTHGTLSLNNDGSFSYTPATGYAGADSFTYKVTDTNGQSAFATINLNVQAAAVTATTDAYAANENQALTISTASGVLANDILPNGETGTITLNTGPTHGTLSLNIDGSFSYTPATGYAGADSFTYKVTDTNGQSAIATVNLNVQAAAVTATSDAYAAKENQALTISTASGILANDILPNGETGTVSVNTGPTHGTLSLNTDGSFTYTPAAGYAGADSFTYKVTDTNGQSAIATVNLNVQAGAVTATSAAYVANENQALTISSASGILANDILPNGENGTIAVTTGPTHGTLNLNTDGSFIYTPATGYAGGDSFTYKVTDTNGQSAIATVNLNVLPAAVTATSDAYAANENQALTISTASGVLANDILPNGETGTITINTGPTHGTLSLNTDGSFTYTPATGYAGADSFTYKVTDTNGQSANSTVNLNIQATAVTATSDAYAAKENQALTISTATGVLANDILPNGETGSVTINSGPSHGTLSLNTDGSFTYTPATGYAGADSFTYKVIDTNGQSAIATVNLNVQAAAVTATSDAYAANENQALTISTASGVLANDILPNGETGTITINTGPAHGALSLNNDGSFTYTPATGYAGADSFTYKVTDTNGQSAIATVNLNVQAAAVTATSDAYATNENQALTISTASGVLANDILPNGETGTITINTGPAHGALSLNTDGSFTYTPATGYAGADSFTYKVTDTNGQSAIATVNLNVQAAAVTATSDAYAANENQALTISTASGVLANDILPNGEAGTVTVNTGPAHGTLSLNTDGSFTYTPSTGYAGADSFTYKVTDTNGQSAIATVNLNIQAAGVTATSDAYAANENQALTISTASGVLANDILPNGETGIVSIKTGPAHGALNLNTDGSFTYVPNTGFVGTDSFDYRVLDSNGQTSTATVIINVQPAPVIANTMNYITNENQTLSTSALSGVLENAGIPSGEYGSASVVTQPIHGGLVFDANGDGGFTYTPNRDFSGTDSFTYKITDTNGQTAFGTVNLYIQTMPVQQIISENTNLVFSTANGNQINLYSSDGNTITVTLTTSNGTFSLANKSGLVFTNGTGTNDRILTIAGAMTDIDNALNGLIFTPNANFIGATSIQISTNDMGQTGGGGSVATSDTIPIQINEVNSASLNMNLPSQTIVENSSLIFSSANGNTISLADFNASIDTDQITLSATNGTLTLNSIKGLTFSAGTGINDNVMTFTGKVSDINAALNGLTFNPASNFSGNASVQIGVNDLGNTGSGGFVTQNGQISIAVQPVSQQAISHITTSDNALTPQTDTVASDTISSDNMIINKPVQGLASLDQSGTITYSADFKANLSDSFAYKIKSGAQTTISITSYAIPATAGSIQSVGNATIVNAPSNGTVIINNDGSFIYKANSDIAAKDSFSYQLAISGSDESLMVTVSINNQNLTHSLSQNEQNIAKDNLTPILSTNSKETVEILGNLVQGSITFNSGASQSMGILKTDDATISLPEKETLQPASNVVNTVAAIAITIDPNDLPEGTASFQTDPTSPNSHTSLVANALNDTQK